MCLSVWYTFEECAPTELKFILLFNRDEFLNRKTSKLHRWPGSSIMAGKDEDEKRVAMGENGTWLGINYKTGRVAWLTNRLQPGLLVPPQFRERKGLKPAPLDHTKKSRGLLVPELLKLDKDYFVEDYLIDLDMSPYGDCNLMVTDDDFKVFCKSDSNNLKQFPDLTSQSMSNSPDGTKIWKKQKMAQKLLNSLVESYSEQNKKVDENFIENCFQILENKHSIDTLDEDIASKMTMEDLFIISEKDKKFCENYQQIFQDHKGDEFEGKYGTRSSTLVFVYRLKDKVKIIERTGKLESNVQVEGCPILKRDVRSGPFEGGTEVRFG